MSIDPDFSKVNWVRDGSGDRHVPSYEIEVGSFPSAVYGIGSSQRIEAGNAPGCAVTVPLRLRAGVDTIYDCASINKTLIATTLMLQTLTTTRRPLADFKLDLG